MLSGGSRHVTSTGEKLQSEGVTLSKPDVTPCKRSMRGFTYRGVRDDIVAAL